MAILGANDIRNLAIPEGVDGNIVAAWQLKEGRTFGEFVNELSQALGSLNTELVNRWGWAFGETQEPSVEYENGDNVKPVPVVTDISKVDASGGDTVGHMLPLELHADGVGGSWKYFERTREAKVKSDIASKVRRMRWTFETKLLKRLFTSTANAVGSGFDLGFCAGSSTAGQKFTPPAFGGKNFAQNHSHYIGVDADSKNHGDLLEELVEHVVEHGHEVPLIAEVSQSDLKQYAALTNKVKVVADVANVIDRGGATSGSQFYARGQQAYGMFGWYESQYGLVELRYSGYLSTGYAGVFKSQGSNVESNPLHVRTAEEGFGVYIIPETSDNRQWPVKKVIVAFEFGVGVGIDRTQGAVGRLHTDGTWANPTIGS